MGQDTELKDDLMNELMTKVFIEQPPAHCSKNRKEWNDLHKR